ncbi:hypothetical protein AA0111_g12702 [Alternaria arborescens]|uniref:hypothetical protein n=1 Tax=Alternaria arborescens TaxID=156630 RepID=UPI001074F3CA|nr:hypothetical protein AA0111_g12702 [Alternaria arborescens]RYO11817.1 hypothetical protein AA0111_g12702 [Alternaria arborescens]
MPMDFLTTSTAGALFGAALASSGVYSPSVIISQMQLANFHMLKVFMAASASSALVLASFNKLGLSNTKPRSPSSLGLFSRYDGNIIGGCMIGLGMTLTGACPGTVLVQLTSGIRSGWYIMAGGILGGILYTRLSGYLRRNQVSISSDTELTVYGVFGVKSHHAVVVYELLCLVLITLVTVLGPKGASVPLHPLLGGALIGAAQAASLVLTGNAVGVSTGYEVIGFYFWQTLDSLLGHEPRKLPAPLKSVYFAAGIVAGSWVLVRLVPPTISETGIDISSLRGIIGGFVMVLGARIAGGCTSGHGISGMSMLSVSSIVTVAFMFVSGFGSALFIS